MRWVVKQGKPGGAHCSDFAALAVLPLWDSERLDELPFV